MISNEAHVVYVTCICVISYPMNFWLTTFTKTLPKCQFTYLFMLFLFRSWAPPMTMLTARALIALPRQLQTCAALMHCRVPSQTKILATPIAIIIHEPAVRDMLSCLFWLQHNGQVPQLKVRDAWHYYQG